MNYLAFQSLYNIGSTEYKIKHNIRKILLKYNLKNQYLEELINIYVYKNLTMIMFMSSSKLFSGLCKQNYVDIIKECFIMNKIPTDILYNGIIESIDYGSLETLRWLHKHDKEIIKDVENFRIICASKTACLMTVKYIHQAGRSIDLYNSQSIKYASKSGHLETVKYLHENGADITADNNYAICLASTNNHLEIVKYLHENGAE